MTKIYENTDSQLVRPKQGQWVRIKNGVYALDLGIVEKIFADDRIYVKLIPRLDPNAFNKKKGEK
jgi:hypothetical protein